MVNSLEGELDEKNGNVFHSSDHGNLYRNSSIRTITDAFGAELRRNRSGNTLTFNPNNLVKIGRAYDNNIGIQTKLVQNEADPETDKRDPCDSCDSLTDNGHMINKSDIGKMDENQAQNSVENDNLMKEFDDNEPKKNYLLPQDESHGSHDSPLDTDKQAEATVKCPTCDYETEPFYMKIHQCPNKTEIK